MKATDIVVADAFFSIRPFVDGIKECGFHLVSRFRDTASLYYVYTGHRSYKPGRPKTLDGKINYKKLDLTRMAELHVEGLEGTAYTLIAYSKALKQKVRLVIWNLERYVRNTSSPDMDVFVEKKSLCFPFGITQMTRRTFCFNAFE